MNGVIRCGGRTLIDLAPVKKYWCLKMFLPVRVRQLV
jgi:hypothetical protein